MRTTIIVIILTLYSFSILAQEGIHYQAVVRDAGGTILANVPVEVDVSIKPSAGTTYTELINSTTNDYGVLNIVIGRNGNMDLKDFNWEFGNASMDLELRAGAKTILIQDQAIQNVPYAYHAQIAQSAIDDKVEDSDADPTNEIQTLTYDSLNNSLMLSEGGTVYLKALKSYWSSNTEGIHTTEKVFIGVPTDSPNVQFQDSLIRFNTPEGDPGSHWSTQEFAFQGEHANSRITSASVSVNSLLSSSPYESRIDTNGFVSTHKNRQEISYQSGGGFFAIKLPDSNRIRSQLLPTSVSVSRGDLHTSLTVDVFGLGGDGMLDYARMDGYRYGRLRLFNNNYLNSVDLNTESGGGELLMNASNSNIQSLLNNNQLSFQEEGLGTYALLSGDGHGALTLYNNANWPAIELNSDIGNGIITISDGVGSEDHIELQHNQIILEEMNERVSIFKNKIEVGDKGGGIDVQLASLDDQGLLNLFNRGDLGFSIGTTSNNGGFASAYHGDNSSLNVLISHYFQSPDKGWIGVYGESGNGEAYMYVDNVGDGRIVADIKNFKMEHPEKENTSIYYASLEGPEAAAYERGTAKLNDGRAEVSFSDHYKIVANPQTMTVMLTPHSADTYGLAVVEKTETGFVVQELKKGGGNFSFDWEVKCKRRGFENWEVEQEDVQAQPLIPKQ